MAPGDLKGYKGSKVALALQDLRGSLGNPDRWVRLVRADQRALLGNPAKMASLGGTGTLVKWDSQDLREPEDSPGHRACQA